MGKLKRKIGVAIFFALLFLMPVSSNGDIIPAGPRCVIVAKVLSQITIQNPVIGILEVERTLRESDTPELSCDLLAAGQVMRVAAQRLLEEGEDFRTQHPFRKDNIIRGELTLFSEGHYFLANAEDIEQYTLPPNIQDLTADPVDKTGSRSISPPSVKQSSVEPSKKVLWYTAGLIAIFSVITCYIILSKRKLR